MVTPKPGTCLQVPQELQTRLAQLVQMTGAALSSSGSSLADAWTSLAGCLDEACHAGGAPEASSTLMRALLGISVDEVGLADSKLCISS